MTLTENEMRDLNSVYSVIFALLQSPNISGELRADLTVFEKRLSRYL